MEAITIDYQSLPLSLKYCCCLKVVANIAKYPVSYLSLLPTVLRRTILFFLPAVEVHRLEGTPFVSDIDTSIHWDELYTRYKTHLVVPMNEYEFVKAPLPAMKKSTCCRARKDEILDGVVQSVFFAGAVPPHYNCERGIYLNVPFAVLVTVRNVAVRLNEDCVGSVSSSVKRLLEYYGLKVLSQSMQFVISKNYESSPVVMENPREVEKDGITKVAVDGIKILVSKFQKYPKAINTSSPSLWIFKEKSVASFISHIQVLCLSGDNIIPEEILKNITSDTCLKTLLINTEVSGNQVHTIAPHFASHKGKDRSRKGYDKLESLSAGKFLRQEKHPRQPNNPLGVIVSIISYQKNLRHVRLYGYFGHSPYVEKLVSALSKLVVQPQLESLMIDGHNRNCQVSTEKFSKILIRFLLNQATHHQHLTFTSFQIVDTKTTLVKMAKLSLDVSKVRIPCLCSSKSLNIVGTQLSSQVVKLLSHIPPVCFDSLGVSLSPKIDYCHELSNLAISHQLLLAADLEDEYCSIPESEVFSKQITGFLLNSKLRFLTIDSIKLTSLESCEALSQALHSQASDIQSLTKIHFRNCFGGSKKEFLKIIFDSLISLAQTVNLDLTFEESSSEKFMNPEHVNLLNESWKTQKCLNGVKQIHKLKCFLFNIGEEELMKIEEVVEELNPTFNHFQEVEGQ